MKRFFIPAAIIAATVVVGCGGDSSTSVNVGTGSTLQVVNATRAPLNIVVDGVSVTTGLGISGLSSHSVGPGTHTVRLVAAGSPVKEFTITATQGVAVTAIVQAGIEGELIQDVLADTAATPAPGKSKLRVIHMAASAPPLNFWRTQPDFATPTRVMFPFPYLAESSYIQSDAGTWTVFATTLADSTTRLADSGPIVANSGEVRTVVLVDSAGVLKFRITTDR